MFGEVDPADALGDLEAAPGQWAAAAEVPVPSLDLSAFSTVVLTGMGGSGISCDIAASLAEDRSPVPVLVHKGHGLPAFAGPATLVVALSCSGNTDETCSAAEAALDRGARLVAIAQGGRLAELTQGGRLAELAHTPGAVGNRDDASQADWIRVATSCPPRHSLGMLLVPLLRTLGLADGLDEALTVLEAVVARSGRDVPAADNPAKRLGLRLASGGAVTVYGGQGLGGPAAYRLKSQLNENAKLPATFGLLPEAGHNEIVGWSQPVPGEQGPRGGVVMLRDPDGEHPHVARVLDVVSQMLAERFDWQERIVAEGRSPLARLASLLLAGDFASVYAALALRRDPTPIVPIEHLKAALREQPAQGERPA